MPLPSRLGAGAQPAGLGAASGPERAAAGPGVLLETRPGAQSEGAAAGTAGDVRGDTWECIWGRVGMYVGIRGNVFGMAWNVRGDGCERLQAPLSLRCPPAFALPPVMVALVWRLYA